MIMEKNPATFHLGSHDDAAESALQEDRQALKLEKIGLRVTLLTILIPCMVGIILLVAWLDVRNRVDRTRRSEAVGLEQLARDLDFRLADLAREQAHIKDVQAHKTAALETSLASLQTSLQAAQAQFDALEAALVAGQAELSRAFTELDSRELATTRSLVADVQTLQDRGRQAAEDVEHVSSSLAELAETLDTLKQGFDRLDRDTTGLAADKIGPKELNRALERRHLATRREFMNITAALDKRMDLLENSAREAKAAQSRTVAVQTIKGTIKAKVAPAQAGSGPAGTDAIEEQTLE